MSAPTSEQITAVTIETVKLPTEQNTVITNEVLRTIVGEWFTNQTDAKSKYGHINSWDTSIVTDMSLLFANKSTFNDNIGNWDTSNVTTMAGMFQNCDTFNQYLNDWNTRNVVDMSYMFDGCDEFNGLISNWTTSQVNNMERMFKNCYSYNQPMNTIVKDINTKYWDTNNVTTMEEMFYGCSVFNQDISNWNVSKVVTFDSMFEFCPMFNNEIRIWNLNTTVSDLTEMFYEATDFLTKYKPPSSELLLFDLSGTPTIGFFNVSSTSIGDISVGSGWNLIYITEYGVISSNTNNIDALYEYNVSNNTYTVIVESAIPNNPISVNINTGYLVHTSSSDPITFTTILYIPPDLQQFNFANNNNISVVEGWNLIGWNSTNSSDIGTIQDETPTIIIANTIHEYNVNGNNRFGLHVTATSIRSNHGYWVKCSGSGSLKIIKNT